MIDNKLITIETMHISKQVQAVRPEHDELNMITQGEKALITLPNGNQFYLVADDNGDLVVFAFPKIIQLTDLSLDRVTIRYNND